MKFKITEIYHNIDFSCPFSWKSTSFLGGKFPQLNSIKIRKKTAFLTWLFTILLFVISTTTAYRFFSHKLNPSILGLEETSFIMPTQRSFSDGYDNANTVNVVVGDTEVRLSAIEGWWNEDYVARRQATLQNISGNTLLVGSTVQLILNTKELYDAGRIQNDCDDLRVVFVATALANTRVEIPRSVTNCNTTASTITFPLQEQIVTSGSDANYEIYYGNSSATAPSFPREKYLSFDGGDLAYINNAFGFDYNHLTIEAWVYVSSLTRQTIIDLSGNSTGLIPQLEINVTGQVEVITPGIYQAVTGNGLITTGRWYHIAYTKNGTADEHAIYIDGVSQTLTSKLAVEYVSTNTMKVIGSRGGVSQFVTGKIDEVRLWNRALTASEITERMNRNVTTADAYWNNLMANWKLDDGTGQTVTDSSGNGFNGTLGVNSNSGTDDPSWVTGGTRAYSVGDKNATLVCPFSGSTTCVNEETPTSATGAIRYSGGKSALSFDGMNDYIDNSFSYSTSSAATVELWANINNLGVNGSQGGSASVIGAGWATGICGWWGSLVLRQDIGGITEFVNIGLLANEWAHYAVVYDGSQVRTYRNGTLVATEPASGVWSINADIAMAGWSARPRMLVDELRISDSVRYTSNFIPQTGSLISDVNTKLLYHFDENGDDPRNIGKVLDASGNGNHGTISGAKYISGLIGVNSSINDTGYLSTQSYASHQGVLLEEGTTNLITNPSFEHVTYNNNWFSPYFNYLTASATFTPNMAKRNSTGPFAAGPMVQGNRIDASGGDSLSIVPGTTISGRFYPNIDTNQGSIVFWITPEWNGNDGVTRALIQDFQLGTIGMWKSSAGMLSFSIGGSSVSNIDISNWVAGTTYNVIARWDTKNLISATNYVSVSVNDLHNFGSTSTITAPAINIIGIGTNGTSNSSSSIIEGFTIYRRPLFDGTYGIDVGNGDEIAQIYNSGTGKDPTLVTGSWDVVFALPTNASTGILSTGTGNAWSHPHSSNLLYTSTTNTGGFMMNGTYANDGWSNYGAYTDISALLTSEKIYAGGYKVTGNTSAALRYTLSTAQGNDYVIRAIAHSDGSCMPTIKVWNNNNGVLITSLAGTNTSTRTDPDVLLFTWEAPSGNTSEIIELYNDSSTGDTCYWHQVEVYTNLVSNPSLESGSGDPWLPTGWSNSGAEVGEVTQETTIVHSGLSAAKFTGDETSDGVYFNHSYSGGKFYAQGGWGKRESGDTFGFMYNQYTQPLQHLSEVNQTGPSHYITGDWSVYHRVVKNSSSYLGTYFGFMKWYNGSIVAYVDDTYVVSLTDVSLTVTPANQTNSTETTGLRVDGADTLTQPITGLSATNGVVKFKYTPRHSAGTMYSFGGVCYVVRFQADASNSFGIYWSDNSSLQIFSVDSDGTDYGVAWNAYGSIIAGTTYHMELRYSSTRMSLWVDGVERVVLDDPTNFTNVPNTAYWGSSSTGGQQADATFSSFVTSSISENTTIPYYKFGSKSVKLIGQDFQDEYAISIDPNSTATHTLSAYVYNGTSGSIGGTVDATVANLYFGSTIVTPSTYTDMGGGWWRLTYSTTTIDASLYYGVQVMAGKTIYVDGVQLEQLGFTTSYADGSFGTGYAWTGTTHDSTSTRTSAALSYPNTNINKNEGSISAWIKLNVSCSVHGNGGKFTILRVNGTDPTWTNMNLGLYYETVHGCYGRLDSNNTYSSSLLNSSGFTQDRWAHVVGTWSATGNMLKVYVNNVVGTSGNYVSGNDYTQSITIGYGSNNGDFVLSDLRVFDSALTASEITDLYYQGLLTHSQADVIVEYEDTGTYYSGQIDLTAVSDWSTGDDIALTQTLNDGSLAVSTCTKNFITDTCSEGDYLSLSGNEIQSDPHRFIFLKAVYTSSSGNYQSPSLTGVRFNYTPDNLAPTNPTDISAFYDDTKERVFVNDYWANSSRPYFTWPRSGEVGGASDSGEGPSGVDGYYVYFGENETADPEIAGTFVEDPVSGEVSFQLPPETALDQDGIYYLRIKTKDNAGSVSLAETLWTYHFDQSEPINPVVVSVNPVGYSSVNSFDFYWPSGSDLDSGVWGYCYKLGTADSESQYYNDQCLEVTSIANIPSYQNGENVFYIRAKDNAGNLNSSYAQVNYYYNASAPSAPLDIVITPADTIEDTNCSSLDNCFTVSFNEPATYLGTIAKYYYSVNEEPDAYNSTETTISETATRTIGPLPLATKQGINTFYIVAEDNIGNVNFDAYGSQTFEAQTSAPGIPTNVQITDSSNRETQKYQLTLTWEAPINIGSGIEHYNIYRSTDGINFSNIATTQSTGYLDTTLSNTVTYYYRITSEDNAQAESAYSSVVSDIPTGRYTTPPEILISPSVETHILSATISWTMERECQGYVQYRENQNDAYWEQGKGEEAVAHEVTVVGLKRDTLYYYRIRCEDEDNNVAYSEEDSFTTSDAPSAPTNLTVTPSSNNQNSFSFSWNAPSDIGVVISSYYYSINQEPNENNISEIEDTELPEGPYATQQGTNTFYVLAIDSAGNFNYDNYASVDFTANTIAPGIPTNVTIIDSSNRDLDDYALTVRFIAPALGEIDHYNIYRKNKREDYQQIAEVISLGYLDSGLDNEITYSYKITAEDNAGKESAYSTIVSRRPTGKYSTPPTIVIAPHVNTGSTTATITWETDRLSNSFVQIGTNEIYTRTQGQWDPVIKHEIVVRGLMPSTTYHYRIQSLDDPDLIDYETENSFSEDNTFTTGELPRIRDLEVTDIKYSSCIVSWITEVPSTSLIYLKSEGGQERIIEDMSVGGITVHTVRLDELIPASNYELRVSGIDEEGNTLIGEEHLFTTAVYPKVFNVELEQQKDKATGTVKVTWQTNVPTTGIIRYNKRNDSRIEEVSTAKLETNHELIISSLFDNTTYEIIVYGRDSLGSQTESNLFTFTTAIDSRPPMISNITIDTRIIGQGSKATAQLIIGWETDELASSQIEYDLGIGEGIGSKTVYSQKTKEDSNLVTTHLIIIPDLNPSQGYHFRILSEDGAGNLTISDNNIVVTDEPAENILELVLESLRRSFGWLFGE